MAKKQVKMMITAFRDGFQSVYGARVLTNDFLPAVEACRRAGITHFEAGGGARFQSLYFYCNEDAFDMMDAFRRAAGPEANLQTLSRGVNVVGLDSQASDIIRLHAKLFKKHGMTTIRNFDALNDVNNLIHSGRCIHEEGLKHEVVVTLMSLPPNVTGAEYAHTPDFYMDTLKNILEAGIPYDSVCFKDASGTTTPTVVHETIKQARAYLPEGTHIRFHSHDTAGNCTLCYMAALDAGADGLDLSMAPVSGGTCQPDVLTMWHALRGADYDLGIDVDKMREAEDVFQECMKDYFLPPEARAVEPIIPFSPMPGGALTANTQMMRDNGILDQYPSVIREMGEVVRRGGFGTSVTPVSQFYFQQAFNNTLFGKWKKIADGYGKMVLGYFGKTPVAPDPEVVRIAAEQLGLEPTTKTVLEINDADPNKGVDAAKRTLQAAGLPENEENVFIAACCGDKGIRFLKGEATVNVRKNAPMHSAPASGCTVTINGKAYAVKLDQGSATVNGTDYAYEVKDGIVEDAAGSAVAKQGNQYPVMSPLPGTVTRVAVAPGQKIAEGETIVVIEAMKMETEIRAPVGGSVLSISVKPGDLVASGQQIVSIAR